MMFSHVVIIVDVDFAHDQELLTVQQATSLSSENKQSDRYSCNDISMPILVKVIA